ncbi:MAG TPA: hypothetical protein ENN58_00625, partial [bacterium]|nr:hypothetical protein [bacterium]
MVQFNTDYFHSLDKDYMKNEFSDTEKNMSGTISIGEIGTSVGERMTATGQMSQAGGSAVDAFQYGIRQGAKSVEIGMNTENIGVGPHAYGPEQREEIKKLSEINDAHI